MVAAFIASCLKQEGYKVGLHITPYLQAATEKIWIDGKFIGPEEFIDLIDWVRPKVLPLRHPKTVASPHGMASVAITLEAFRRAKIDIAVIETGCGGRYDLTNFLNTILAVITNVGLDHTRSLGESLEEIAYHKAGIIKPKVPVVTGAQGDALKVIEEQANSLKSPLKIISFPSDLFLERDKLLAIEALYSLSDSFPVSKEAIEQGTSRIPLAGRLEEMSERVVYLDAAHNPDKIHSLVYALPRSRDIIAVVGMLEAKDVTKMVNILCPRVRIFICTRFNVYGKKVISLEKLERICACTGLPTYSCSDVGEALSLAFKLRKARDLILVTGSVYLIGEAREEWYPKKEVVLQGTSWPKLTYSRTVN